MSREHPILFRGPMIRAILAGHKTQTRRLINPQPAGNFSDGDSQIRHVPWQVGRRLWVREAWALVPATAYRHSVGVQQTVCPHDLDMAAVYRAGWDRCRPGRWRPSIHMPRWASRLTLEVLAVRAERLQSMTEADCIAEGCLLFRCLWDSINLKRGHGWDRNPWVWVVTFRRMP